MNMYIKGVTMAGLFNDIWGSVFGTSNNNEAKAKEQYDAQVDAAKDNLRSSSQLYQAGRGAAGQVAADKAGIAKQQGKAAAMMNGASKLQGAIQGAAGAVQASQQGYDETANNAAAIESGIDKQKMQADTAKAQEEIDSAKAKDAAVNANRKALRDNAVQIMSTFSDKNVKSFKQHRYLSADERRK